MVHSALAFHSDGLPLGLLDIECWARDPSEFGKKKQRHSKPIAAKESFKWIRTLTPIGNAAAQCPSTCVVTLTDRESDIFEYLMEARSRQLDVVVRAKDNRAPTAKCSACGRICTCGPRPGRSSFRFPAMASSRPVPLR
jgi:hypothetical protein